MAPTATKLKMSGDIAVRRSAGIRKENAAVGRRVFNIVIKAVFVVALLAMLHVSLQNMVDQKVIESVEVKKRIIAAKLAVNRLKVEDIGLQSPERLTRIAVDSLGMVKPKEVKYLTIPDNYGSKESVVTEKKGYLAVGRGLWRKWKNKLFTAGII